MNVKDLNVGNKADSQNKRLELETSRKQRLKARTVPKRSG